MLPPKSISVSKELCFRSSVVWLVFSFFGLVSLFLEEGATAAALQSEAAVDEGWKEVADCVASLKARLGTREIETMLLVLPHKNIQTRCNSEDEKKDASTRQTKHATPILPLDTDEVSHRGERNNHHSSFITIISQHDSLP